MASKPFVMEKARQDRYHGQVQDESSARSDYASTDAGDALLSWSDSSLDTGTGAGADAETESRDTVTGHAPSPTPDIEGHFHHPSASLAARPSPSGQVHQQQQQAISPLHRSTDTLPNKKTRSKAPLPLQLSTPSPSLVGSSPTSRPINEAYAQASAPSATTIAISPLSTPSSASHTQQGIPSRHQPLSATPKVTFTPGSPKGEEANHYFSPEHRQHKLALEQQQTQAQEQGQAQGQEPHYLHHDQLQSLGKEYTSPASEQSLVGRAKRAVQSILMVASPRLPFYSARDEDSHTTWGNNDGPFTPQGGSHSPLMQKQHSNGFTGPSSLFGASSNNTSSNRGLFSPSLHAAASSAFGSSSLSPNIAQTSTLGGARSHHHNPKRSFYKDKDASSSLYPTVGSSYDSGFRKGGTGGVGILPTTPVKASFFRIPRSIARLASRRSRVLPAILLCVFIFFYALGTTRTTSLYDAAQQASARQVGKFFEAADARVGHLNPMKWAMQNSQAEEENTSSNTGGILGALRNGRNNKQKTFNSPDGGIVERFDVELLDPSGPLAQPGKVGSAELRYKSWEGGRLDSRMLVEEGKPHPIPKLMARAKQRWHALKSRQSKNFAEAVS